MTHQRFAFDLKLAFLAMTNACVVAWAVPNVHRQNIIGISAALAVMIVPALSFAAYGRKPGRHPLLLGAIGGFAGVFAFVACLFPLVGIGYFFHDGPEEYFEDGAFTELVIFPPMFLVIWGSFGAVVGTICGAIVWGIQRTFGRGGV